MTFVTITHGGVVWYAVKYNLTGASSPTTVWLDVVYSLEQAAPSNFLSIVSTGVTDEISVTERRSNSTVNLSNGNRGIGSVNPQSKLTFGSTELFSIGMDRRVGTANGQTLSIAAGGAQTGIVSTFSISVAGTGYAIGDTIAVTETFGSYAILVVNSIGASGTATGFDIASGGDSFDTGSSGTSTISGSGSGCIINILTTVKATNAQGGNLTLSGGISTGTGSSTISFLTASTGASGATDNTPLERMRISTVGNLGVATTGPDRKVDVLDAAAPQLRLTYTDGSIFTDLQTNSSGNLNIIPSGGFVGINTATPTSRADITGANGYTQLRLRTTYTPTSSADALGNVGDIAHDANYFYIKTSGGWKRAALSTF
jgi:hypothetical protein